MDKTEIVELSQEVARVRARRFSIENQICDLYKRCNELLEDHTYANKEEAEVILNTQRFCIEMLYFVRPMTTI